jgi:hypothetical protein
MTPQTDLPPHLERFGRQLVAAAHEQADAAPTRKRRWRRPTLIVTPVVVAAVVAAVVLITTAGPTTSKAYALTPNGNGSYTLTINDIATAVPQLNAAFERLGIHAKAIPVTADCVPEKGTFVPPLMSSNNAPPTTESITLSNRNVPAGWTVYIAAEETPAGVRLTLGSTAAPLPSCMNSNEVPPVIVNPVVVTNGTTSTISTTISGTTTP